MADNTALQAMMDDSAQVRNAQSLQAMMNASPQASSVQALQRKANARTEKADGVVQKVVAPFKTPAMPTAEELLIIADANTLDGLTNAAYQNTMNHLAAAVAPIPTPLHIGQFPGATLGHFTHMCEMLGGYNNTLKAAAVGYVIEDQVTHGGGRPAAAQPQYGVGNAIPDFVISHGADGAERRGIVDITTTNQLGHVLEKDFNIGPYSLVWESIYPSIDFGALGAGAVALAPATAALIADSKRRRANSYITEKLYRINRHLDLLYDGVMHNNGFFRHQGQTLRAFLNNLPRDVAWTIPQVATANIHIGNVNNLLHPDFRISTLDQIIIAAQDRYLVAGLPIW